MSSPVGLRAPQPSRSRARCVGLGLLAGTASLAFATSAHAATATWTCRADAVTASVAGMTTLDPITATRTPCSDQSVGLPQFVESFDVHVMPFVKAQERWGELVKV